MKILFSNTEVAFRGKTTADLRRSYFIFKLLNDPFLVKVGTLIARFALFLHLPVRALIRATIFRQFCGGETLQESLEKAEVLSHFGVHTILDVAVEGSQTEAVFNETTQEVLRTIKLAESRVFLPFSVFKMTGIASASLLEKVQKKGRLDSFEEGRWEAAKARVLALCQAAYDKKLRFLIDAEESWIQECIDHTAKDLMQKFNQKEALIYNTVQMYRKDRLDYIVRSLAHAKEHGYFLGLKIVRGAYLEKERQRAAENGVSSPVFDHKEETDELYDKAVSFCVEHIDRIALVAGTHNEKSTELLIGEMEKREISPSDKRIYFSQLFGMSDHLSYHLALNGFNVAKYLPYGDVRVLLPYLIRRAQENTAVHGQTPRELAMLKHEIARRREKSRI